MTKPDDQLHHTAIHEAGHAVAHVRLGLGHDGAHIIPTEADFARFLRFQGYAP